MNRFKNSNSSLFLIELIIAILFFSIGSAVCVQAFVRAHLLSRSAQDLSFASAQVSSAASVVKYTDGTLESVSEYFPEITQSSDADGSELVLCYDSSRAPCPEADAAYIMTIRTDTSGTVAISRIAMQTSDGEPLYELEIRYPAYETQNRGNES